jgi:hypothetical protein
MTQPMTLEEFIEVLESQGFKSTFKGRPERPIFSFKDGVVLRDGVFWGKYLIARQKDNFKISFYDTEEFLSTDIYRNIVIVVKGDNRFPISLVFSFGSIDIIMEAVNN